MTKRSVVSWTAMLSTLAKSGGITAARSVFEAMPARDLAAWNALISAYAQAGRLKEAIELFKQAPDLNVVTLTVMIRLYAFKSEVEESQRLFDTMQRRNAVTWTTLMVAYAENGGFGSCVEIFGRMPLWDLIACTAMVDLYSQHGRVDEAVSLFHAMQNRNVVSWIALLAAYWRNGDARRATKVFDLFPVTCMISSSVMITGYAQNGAFDSARELFERLPERDIGCWNAMIAASVVDGRARLGLRMFKLMELEGHHPDRLTYISTLDACAQIPSLPDGRLIHKLVPEDILLNLEVSTALLNLYSKCGALDEALFLFDRMSSRDAVCWSCMIAAYAQNGHAVEALDTFSLMALEGVEPQPATFLSIFSACGHGGLCMQAISWFVSMDRDFGVAASFEHYRCIVDLLARAGHLNEAEDLGYNMPFEPDAATWRSCLGACKVHWSAELGQSAARSLHELDPLDAATYILLSSLS